MYKYKLSVSSSTISFPAVNLKNLSQFATCSKNHGKKLPN